MKRNKWLLLACSFIGLHPACAQIKDYEYMRPVTGVSQNTWYTIDLPPEIFSHLNRNFTDLRLYSITKSDTLEIPYLLTIQEDDIVRQKLDLPILNQTKKGTQQFVTFELKKEQAVNELSLTFNEQNFHAKVTLEGSQEQKEWYVIAEDLRIVCLRTNTINYCYNTLSFPESKFRFLRATIDPDVPLTLKQAALTYQQTEKGEYKSIPVTWSSEENEYGKTIATVRLAHKVPVSKLTIDIASDRDFYRTFMLEALLDSVQGQNGWLKSYDVLYTGHLTSLQPNTFGFTYELTQELRFTISNEDNSPLKIEGVSVYYPAVTLVAQIVSENNYLVYGNKNARKPSYDLVYFTEKIPQQKQSAQLGSETYQVLPETVAPPLLTNTLWLWVILVFAVIILGYFTLRMMKQSQSSE